MKSLFVFVMLASSVSFAAGGTRDFGPFVGGSLSKNFGTVTQPGVNASLNGSGYSAEIGLDLPFSDTFGFSTSFELGQTELRNTASSSTYLDYTKINSKTVNGSFFYKSIYAGAGFSQNGVDLTTISTTTGASTAHVDANGLEYFAGYAFTYKNLLRANAEFSSKGFEATGFKYSDYSFSLKLQLLVGGFLER